MKSSSLTRFLLNRASEFMSWNDGRIIIDSNLDRQFRALGGDTTRLLALFEDCGNAHEAAQKYLD